MTSAAYKLFRQAILEEKQVTCVYNGHYRELCPHIIGHTGSEEKVLAFQFDGSSSSKLPPRGEWRCLVLANVTDVRLRDGPWRAGGSHRQQQSCVEDIDLDINVHVRPSAERRRRTQQQSQGTVKVELDVRARRPSAGRSSTPSKTAQKGPGRKPARKAR
jgi:hypothetical protein